jgi:hypothetical protein
MKRLEVRVLEIRPKVITAFQVDQIIGSFIAGDVEHKTVTFGRGRNVDVRFS